MYFFFFFKQKTAYEMRISDWSSDVCSSDLPAAQLVDETGGDGGSRNVTPGSGHARREIVDVIVDLGAGPRARHIAFPTRPYRVDQRLRGSLRLGRLIPADEGFDRRLEGSDAKHLDTHGQLVEQDLVRSDEHTFELQSLMRIPYAVYGFKKHTE